MAIIDVSWWSTFEWFLAGLIVLASIVLIIDFVYLYCNSRAKSYEIDGIPLEKFNKSANIPTSSIDDSFYFANVKPIDTDSCNETIQTKPNTLHGKPPSFSKGI